MYYDSGVEFNIESNLRHQSGDESKTRPLDKARAIFFAHFARLVNLNLRHILIRRGFAMVTFDGKRIDIA